MFFIPDLSSQRETGAALRFRRILVRAMRGSRPQTLANMSRIIPARVFLRSWQSSSVYAQSTQRADPSPRTSSDGKPYRYPGCAPHFPDGI